METPPVEWAYVIEIPFDVSYWGPDPGYESPSPIGGKELKPPSAEFLEYVRASEPLRREQEEYD